MRRSRLHLRALAGLALAGATTAQAAPAPVNADLLTVSGRFEAPRAPEGPLKGRVKVAEATIAPGDGVILLADVKAFQVALRSALEASMRNFGYLAAPDQADTLTIEVRMDPLEMRPDADGISAVARLHVSAKGPGEGCVPTLAEAKYHALAPIRGGNGQRAVGIAGIVIFAMVGLDASQFATAQFQDAAKGELAMNAQRVRTESEGVSPQGGDKQVARYAAFEATQLAAADLIRQLGKGACAAPAPAPSTAAP
jgi:hypothetical protein